MMTDLEKAARQALEALKLIDEAVPFPVAKLAQAALRQALEQPAQQEIDWKDQYEKQKRRADMWIAKYEADIGPLEKAGPVAAQQEPVAWMYVNTDGECEEIEYGEPFDDPFVTPLYTRPQARKPLTDEQRKYVVEMWKGGNWTAGDIIDAVEAAHGIGEKNNG